ncbi:MAG: B12-binding domain-containing radical SAM protein [Lachnospiraceae bacterium]|nr:B12-binding domain-containing radical SAM protein [Lachnospiraceae bacterium]
MRDNDVLFFNLHRPYLDSVVGKGGFAGIYLLAAFLNDNGYWAQSFSGTLKDGNSILEDACLSCVPKVVGLYCDYGNVTENIWFCRHIKEKYNIPVIIGGPQATALKKDFYEESNCDAVVIGEGELTVLELVDYFIDGTGSLNEIDGIRILQNGELIATKPRNLVMNLDNLPFVTEECYLDPTRISDELWILTGRGCPFHCAFCHEGHHTQKVRFRSVENVIKEVDKFLEKHSGKAVRLYFTDDTFTLDSKRVKEMCEALAKRRERSNLRWFCEGHVHTILKHPEMLEYLAMGGCQRLQLGIEALTVEELDEYGKNTTPEEIFEVVKLCTEAGIDQIYGNIILGGAHFSREKAKINLERAKELISFAKGSLELSVISFWPLPNTTMTKNPSKFGMKIVDLDFDEAVDDLPQTETDDLTRWDIAEIMNTMNDALTQHMLDMLRNEVVPLEKIFTWFDEKDDFNYGGRWHRTLYTDAPLYSYYHLLGMHEAQKQAAVENFWHSAYPVRVIPIFKHVKKTSDGAKILVSGNKEIFINELECQTLLLSTGRHDIAWVLKELNNRGFIVDDEILHNIYDKLEKHHLVVFLSE